MDNNSVSSIMDQTFVLLDVYPEICWYYCLPMEVVGVLGLAAAHPSSASNQSGSSSPSFVHNLFSKGLVSQPLFTLSATNSTTVSNELAIGGIESSKYVGDLTWTPVLMTEQRYWKFSVA